MIVVILTKLCGLSQVSVVIFETNDLHKEFIRLFMLVPFMPSFSLVAPHHYVFLPPITMCSCPPSLCVLAPPSLCVLAPHHYVFLPPITMCSCPPSLCVLAPHHYVFLPPITMCSCPPSLCVLAPHHCVLAHHHYVFLPQVIQSGSRWPMGSPASRSPGKPPRPIPPSVSR